jgi:4-hydroxybenzoyl-CoA reductase subunit alpha
VPTILDSPDIHVHIVESMDPNGPYGAKEASEGGLAGFLPALAEAVAEATGLDLNEMPITPDKVIDALVKQRRRRARKEVAE